MGHPVFVRVFAAVAALAEDRGLGKLRAKAVAGIEGTVVEVGAGSGLNFAHYSDSVSQIIAVEPEAYLRERAATLADERVRLLEGTAEALPVADDSADAVLFCLVLCSVTDQAAALTEAARVLRPGGTLHLLEHVQAHRPGPMRSLQRGLDATVWPALFGGCHCSRDTEAAVEAAGFEWVVKERRHYPDVPRLPVSPHVYAVARRRESTDPGLPR